MKSPLKSKINWTQLVAVLAMLLTVFGVDLPTEQQLAIVAAIQGVQSVVTWIWRTYFTTQLTPASAARAGLSCHPVPVLVALALALALAGCAGRVGDVVRQAAPRTVAGWEAGGIAGAAGGFAEGVELVAGRVLVVCRDLDGRAVRIDATAELVGLDGAVDGVRAWRRKICAGAGHLAAPVPLPPAAAPLP